MKSKQFYLRKKLSIEKAKKLLKNTKDPTHGLRHSQNVAKLVKIIYSRLDSCTQEQIDLDLTEISAWYHDISYIKRPESLSQYLFESFRGAKLATKILKDIGFTKKELKIIYDTIKCHSDTGRIVCRRAPASSLLIDADILDRVTAQGIKEARETTKENIYGKIRHLMFNRQETRNFSLIRKLLIYPESKQLFDEIVPQKIKK